MIQHLEREKTSINDGLNRLALLDKVRNNYTEPALISEINIIKLACGHSPCPVADNYEG